MYWAMLPVSFLSGMGLGVELVERRLLGEFLPCPLCISSELGSVFALHSESAPATT